LDKQVPMLEDLVGFFKSVDWRTKDKILGCKKKVATPKFTTPIELLLNASKALQFALLIGESCSFAAMISLINIKKNRKSVNR
jgi:hypothetical protein